ncbi:hypothetical protein OG884_02160 [Streptosporangium sp. NBC_01755]|uniref:hypothetical protein n=1 Tax=Streptosporangium sp. NBC_01755 TaxID=2975949 RepID=UPI002DD8E216|nr:hypothetical protein [Streptosporangium sp. NBC_01755]WSD00764.1 hypothetical protein OG884_02160 [Streptosporangium sp. NBC_01755]
MSQIGSLGSSIRTQPSELLDILETEWRPRLRAVSLVTEVEASGETLAMAAAALGELYRLKVFKGKFQTLFDRWPGCVAVALSGVAATDYRQGTFWPYWWKATGYQHGTAQDQTAWGRGFAHALETFGLPTFPDMSLTYVGPILMHAGIPTYCLEDVFRLLLQRRAQDPGLDAEAFLTWAVGREGRLNSLDEPARRFIRHGTDYAMDVLDRCFDLTDRLHSPDPDLDGLGLPTRFVEEAQNLATRGRLDLTRYDAAEARRGRTERPRLSLDPFGQGVQVVLPPVGDAPDGTARWTVTVDGLQNIVRSRSLWVGTAEAAPSTTFAIAQPARRAQVSLYGSAHEVELEIVDPADPLLVFTEDGRHLPGHLALPPDTVWLLHPADREPACDVAPRVVTESPLPIGWDGWRLVLVSLEGATWIGLGGGAARRPVRGHSKPRVLTGAPVTGVTTPYGSAVFAELPSIWLPAERETTWLVDIRPSAGGRTVFTGSFTVSEPTEISERLWETLPRPVLGAFEITVRGPIGRNTRRSIVIAESLTSRCTPQIRLFNHEGLVAGQASLAAGSGMRVEPAVLTYTPREREHVITCSTDQHAEPFIVAPPHMRVLVEEAGQSPRWHASPLRLVTEEVERLESLRVEVPGVDALPSVEILAGGKSVQEVPSSGRGLYNLKRATTTLKAHRSADLILPFLGRAVPVAGVRPAKLASAVTYRENRLVLEDGIWIEGLSAGIYLTTAPWREPEIIPVEQDCSIPLPAHLVDAGQLHVRLAIQDPWLWEEWPRWPHPREIFVCDAPGRFGGADEEEAAISGYLAGMNELPTEVSRLERLWAIVDLANRIDHRSANRRIDEIATVLRHHSDAVQVLPEAALPPDRTIVALITTGLAAAPAPEYRESHGRLWRKYPAVAALLTGSALPGQATEESDLLANIEAQCGETAGRLLLGEADPDAEVGRFGPDAEWMAQQTPEQLENLWRAVNVVPSALLDKDTRVAAARQLFDKRTSYDARDVANQAARVLREAMSIKLTDYRGVERSIEARCHPLRRDGWLALPAASIAFALVARIAARGHSGCRHLEREFRPMWRALSKIAPDLTTIDLIRAELLLAGRADQAGR